MSNPTLLRELLKERILVLDGATGTFLQGLHLTAADFGGPELEGCNEALILNHPKAIELLHRAYLDAGCDIIETNTFGGTPLVLAEYGLQDKAHEINKTATLLARRLADEYSTSAKPRFVAGSIGPTTKSITVTGGITFQELIEHFYHQAKALIEGGVDLLLIETCQDTRNVKSAIIGCRQAMQEAGLDLPISVSGTIEPMGTMLAGQTVEALYASLEHANLLSIGINCATGPQFMTGHIRSLSDIATCLISCYPNAGLPDEEGHYNETPQSLVASLEKFADNGWINLLGGCCGTTPAHIQAIVEMVKDKKPRIPQSKAKCHISGIDYLELSDEDRPFFVGERTNVIGSRNFKTMIVEEQYEEASEIARRQVRNGAHVIDVCLANPDRDEMIDMEKFLSFLIKKVKAPIMIDSTDAEVIERSLQYTQGKSIINSINLEDGEERFARVVPIAHKYGATLVVGAIDDDPENGMAVTAERKLAVAKRSYDLLTNKYGIKPQDIIFDPLVFPCSTGDEKYIGSAVETINGVAAIKAAYPECKTILGVSNISFGLPAAGREVLNAVFLYHCTKAGLDYAIVNTEKLERYASIPEEEKHLAENLLFNRGNDPAGAFAAHFKHKKTVEKPPKESLPLETRLSNYVIEGSKDGLIDDLNEAMQSQKPLEIINGPLMAGMDEVGRLFNKNELIVAEVLQSAEVMKTAVSHLEQFMEKADISTKGVMLLATVKGDVHDIGKNLVEMIFSNNGYKIINLGIKVHPEVIIKAAKEHSPDLIGLSGLLVKSAQQMTITAEDLKAAGISVPLMVGGAALSKTFTRLKIAPKYDGMVVYAKDAMHGLDLTNQLMDADRRQKLMAELLADDEILQRRADKKEEAGQEKHERKRVTVSRDNDIPSPPGYKPTILNDYSLDEVFSYINLQMLLGKHLGLHGPIERMLEEKDEKAVKLYTQVRKFQDEIIEKKILKARAVFRFFPAKSHEDELQIWDTDKKHILETFVFPRQLDKDGLCLSDYVSPDRDDNINLFITTCSDATMLEWSDRFKQNGELLKSHMLQAIALESAEAFAELLHEKIRRMWGFPDPKELSFKEKLHAKYRGIRVSFGYPACPRLEDQEQLFRLLKPEETIGVRLTEGFMMEPEASVSAMVFHHPEAKYFTISDSDLKQFENKSADKKTIPSCSCKSC